MFDPKSDYALNKKDPDAIVYIDVHGKLIRLTVEDFGTVDEFQKWKALSDEDYHITENAENVHTKHTERMGEYMGFVRSPESIMLEKQEQRERMELGRMLMDGFADCLTPTQRYRLWLYCIDGMTEQEIAQTENVKQQNVSKSILAAKKKLKKILISRV